MRPAEASLAAVCLAACAAPRPPAAATAAPQPVPVAVAAPAETPALTRFRDDARKMGLVFDMPAGYVETPVRDNIDVSYDYAVVNAAKRIEMRFALRPYKADAPPPTRTRDFSWLFFMTGVSNLIHGGQSGASVPEQPVPEQHFNADVAKMVVLRWFPGHDDPKHFSDGYGVGAAIFFHRDGVGDAYTFVLLKDRDALGGMDEETMHVLRFAPKP
jgi:hypothetical protein